MYFAMQRIKSSAQACTKLKTIPWKQEHFVSEYLLSGNAAEAARRAGDQTRYLSEIGYGLKRQPKQGQSSPSSASGRLDNDLWIKCEYVESKDKYLSGYTSAQPVRAKLL